MAPRDRWRGFPPLPQNTSSTPNGKYSVHYSEEQNITADGPEYEYSIWFQTPPFDPTTIQRLHSLQLVAESHDQGYCDDPLAGNWTWFELAIMEDEHSELPRIKDGIELTWISHVNQFCTEEYGWKAGKIFPSDHDIFRLLEDGNVVAVRLCARFQGWEMWAESGYLMIEIVAAIDRPSLNYEQIAFRTKTVQEAFQEVNSALLPDPMRLVAVPDTLFSAEMLTSAGARPLRVLSLDGGGVRGIAALILLDAVMKKAAPNKKPCEVFDLIGGTSTGGFIAIMLGRLKMSIDECLAKYKQFMNTVFPPKTWKKTSLVAKGAMYDASALEGVIKSLVKEKLGSEEGLLMDEKSEKDSCKIFAIPAKQTGSNNSAPVFLRSYKNPLEMSEIPGIKVWDAARATSAASTYFVPMKVGNTAFLDGGLQANNPLGWLWNEVLSVFGPARATTCFLSIGTGIPASQTVSDPRNIVGFAESVASIATNSDFTNILLRSLINAFAPQGMAKKYWRFKVGDGLPDWVEEGGVWKWKLLSVRKEENIGESDDVGAIKQTEERAKTYLQTPAADQMLAECAEALGKKLG